MFCCGTKITKEFILSQVSEEEIFNRYLGFYPDYNGSFINTLRKDNNPGCKFYHNGYKIKFVDHPIHFNEDAIGIVQYKYKVSYYRALEIIANDFKLIEGGNNNNIFSITNISTGEIDFRKKEVDIKIIERDFTIADKVYWQSYFINRKHLEKYNVVSVSELFIDNPKKEKQSHYKFKSNELAFAYKEDKYYKIYQPLNKEHKWISNIPHRLYSGYKQLDHFGDCCIITKSLKDVIAMSTFNLPAVSVQAESSIISSNGFNLLSSKYKTLVTLMDFDKAGIKNAYKHQKKYNIKPLFFTNGRFKTKDYGSKDFSDYLRTNGREEMKKLIKEVENQLL